MGNLGSLTHPPFNFFFQLAPNFLGCPAPASPPSQTHPRSGKAKQSCF